MPDFIWEQINQFLMIANTLLPFIIIFVIVLLFCIVLSMIKTRLKRYANSQYRKKSKPSSQKHSKHFSQK